MDLDHPTNSQSQASLRAYFLTLFRAYGHQHWWPARSRFEVIVGAYLTQNTAWTNVELAMRQLRAARVLSVQGIRRTRLPRLEKLVRSAGYFRQKAQRLKLFVKFLDRNYGGSLARMFRQPTAELRQQLLALNGIGPETADAILLYAGSHPVFVVDSYTRRILERHGILPANAEYEEIRQLFEIALLPLAESFPDFVSGSSPLESAGLAGSSQPPSLMSAARRTAQAQVFNEMHGLIVGVGKNFCHKSAPHCERCPLRPFLPPDGDLAASIQGSDSASDASLHL